MIETNCNDHNDVERDGRPEKRKIVSRDKTVKKPVFRSPGGEGFNRLPIFRGRRRGGSGPRVLDRIRIGEIQKV